MQDTEALFSCATYNAVVSEARSAKGKLNEYKFLILQDSDLDTVPSLLRYIQLLLDTFETLACECAKTSPPADMLYAVQNTLASVRVSVSTFGPVKKSLPISCIEAPDKTQGID